MNFHSATNTYVTKVHLHVTNIARSIVFYTKIIGLKILEKESKKVTFTADGITPLLTITEPDDVQPKKSNTTGLYHVAFLLPSRSHLANIFHHFQTITYPISASDHQVSEALYLSDPDGNGIEIYADRPHETWEWKNNEVALVTKRLNVQSLLREKTDEPWTEVPTNTKIGHIHLQVNNLHDAATFYKDGLGFSIVSTFEHSALFLSTGNYHHHIALNTWAGSSATTPAHNSVGLHSFSIQFPNEMEREKAISRLAQLYAPIKEINGELFVTDPFRNDIQLKV